MALRHDLISLLADGKFHSGEELGQALSLTRSAIWKITKQLTDLGINLHRIKGKGYQIPSGIDLLNNDTILSQVREDTQKQINLLVVSEVDSTNQYLLEARSKLPTGTLLFAEYQSKGRGRQQRKWLSPFGANLYCSLLWKFNKDPSELNGLSLATGVALVNALERCGLRDIQLKWPNDLLWQYKKFAGILIEMTAETNSRTEIVIGVGINVHMPDIKEINPDWIDVSSIVGRKLDRNLLAAYLIEELIEMVATFETKGFQPFVKPWQSLDAFYDLPVKIITSQSEVSGYAKGITESGEFLLQQDSSKQVLKFLHGDVSLRKQDF
jgi:BirA family biotin operon repressor/biotin-[acetyl-CoA-carboxylase] ligase